MNGKKQPKRWKRWLKRALVALLVLFILALIVHQVWNYRAGKALERELDAIRAAGDPLTLEELWPPEIEPKSENAAYLYQAAFNLLAAGGFEEAERSLGEVDLDDDPAAWPEETAARIRDLIERYAQPLELIRRAAQMERSRFDLDLTFPGTVSMEHLIGLSKASRLLRWSALLRLRDGDVNGALEDARTAFLLTNAVADEPVIISLLFRSTLINGSLATTELVLGEHQPGPETSRAFLRDLQPAAASLRAHLVRVFKGERVAFRTLMAPFSGQWDIIPLEMRVAAPYIPRRSISAFLGRPFIRSMLLGYLNMVPRIVEISRADWVDARPLMEALEADAAEWETRYMRHYSRIFAAMIVPALIRLKQVETRTEARLAGAEAALALKLYRADRGEYPDSLDALAPEFLESVPRDPFAGEPLKYVREGEGFLVYSLGPNGVDDGGLTETETTGRKVNPGADDIAWRARR